MMRRGGGAPGKEGDKVMGPLFPRLHVNDSTLKGGGPRAPPRNKMALYEQFSVPASSHRPFNATTANANAASAGQIGGSDRPLFPSFCVPSNEPVRSSDHINTNSNGRDGSAARVESGRISTQLRSKDSYAAGSTAECSSQRRENNTKSAAGKKLTNDDDFTVPSVFCSGGVPLQSAREEVRIQEKSTPLPSTSPYKSGPTMSKSSAKYSNTDKRYLEGMNASDTRSRDSPSIKDKAPAKTTTNSEAGARTSSFQFFSTEKTGKTDDKASSYRERLSSINVSDKQHSRAEGHQAGRRNENAAESQNVPKAGGGPYSTDTGCNGASNMSDKSLREGGGKRKRSTGHHDAQKDDYSEDSSVDSLPGLEICPEDVVGAIGPKHFWKARRAIVNQQRVFAVQVFELHRLIKVQKLIAASPHLLIEGDPCLGTALVTSKKKLAAANVVKQLSSAKSKDDDDAQLTLQQAEYSKDNTEGNQASPSQDDDVVEVQHDNNNQAVSTGAVSSKPPAATMPAPPDSNKQSSNWCAPPPPNQWLVPVMSPSEGLVYKPYAGPCPPAGSFLAPFYAGCAPLSLPSTAGDYMASPYGIPMPHHHQQQHMGVVGGPPPMPPMYFPPFTMPVMNNPVVSSSAVEQASRVAPARPTAEHLSRTSCNMRNEAVSGGVWRFHSSAARDSELQGSSAASSPFDRQQQQGEAKGAATAPPPTIPVSSAGNNNNNNGGQQPSSGGSKETPVVARVIRVVPHTARTASESAARIFRSIQMERQQNDP